MLSMSNVSNSVAASSYYEQADDYYSQDRSPSAWSGLAASTLGLEGPAEPKAFRALLDGRLPNGEALHHGAGGRRGGTDLTFSAPKSMSMQALIDGDTRLLLAHETAVARALEYAESLASCRVTLNHQVSRETTGNLLVAQFRHDLSRAADPQLHTHCVVLNVTQRADGAWRALDNEPLYRNKMLMGAYYRSELAKEVQALGYGVRVTHGDGRFELAHIIPAQIEAFSTRSRAIELALQAQGLTREQASAQKLQTIALQTREKKTEIDRAILHAEWQDRAREVGLNFRARLEARAPDATQRAQHAAAAVAYATAHLIERDAVISDVDLTRAALERGTGRTDLEAIQQATQEAVARGDLIRCGVRYTTPEAQQMERDILHMEEAGRKKSTPIMAMDAINRALVGTTLNEGQRETVRKTLAGENRIQGLQGMAGTGKTTALRIVQALASAREIDIVGVAPSAGAARELSGSGIKSQTLASLSSRQYAGLDHKTLIVLDEAGMVSVRDMHGLLSAAEKAQSRVLLVGDVNQLKAIEAGKPFAQLQAAGMATTHLKEIQRQKDGVLKAAVELAALGEVQASLAKLETRIVEIEYHKHRHERMASDFAALSPEARANTHMLAGTNQHRQAINTAVRSELGLVGQGKSFATLTRKDLTEAQAKRSVSYQLGDVVRADKNYKTLGLARGDLAQVVEGPPGVVTLERQDGARVEWSPVHQPHLCAYTQYTRELALGDVVRFTENDRQHGIVNGERCTVTSINSEKQLINLQKADGSIVTLDTSKPLCLDHGYCSTVHAAQGQTAERVLIEADTRSATANESAYYVAISRASDQLTIYTDDKQALPEVMGREDAKDAALDVQLGSQEAEFER